MIFLKATLALANWLLREVCALQCSLGLHCFFLKMGYAQKPLLFQPQPTSNMTSFKAVPSVPVCLNYAFPTGPCNCASCPSLSKDLVPPLELTSFLVAAPCKVACTACDLLTVNTLVTALFLDQWYGLSYLFCPKTEIQESSYQFLQ